MRLIFLTFWVWILTQQFIVVSLYWKYVVPQIYLFLYKTSLTSMVFPDEGVLLMDRQRNYGRQCSVKGWPN